jgi:hypothetical protein
MGRTRQVFKPKFGGWDDLGGRKGSTDMSISGASPLSLNSTSLSTPKSTAVFLHPNNYSKDTFAHHSNSILPPLLPRLLTELVTLFVDRYVSVPDEEAIGMMDEINGFHGVLRL